MQPPKYKVGDTVWYFQGHKEKIGGNIIHVIPAGTMPGVFENYYVIDQFNNVDQIIVIYPENTLSLTQM
jgi:hypothetical protein